VGLAADGLEGCLHDDAGGRQHAAVGVQRWRALGLERRRRHRAVNHGFDRLRRLDLPLW
jgi:hypothetical protein